MILTHEADFDVDAIYEELRDLGYTDKSASDFLAMMPRLSIKVDIDTHSGKVVSCDCCNN